MNEKLKPFAYFANEKGDFTVVYEPNSENELVVTYIKKEERANATCDNLNKLWNTRTLSGQGKESLQEDKLLGEIKMILYKVMHLGKETLSAESNERIIHKDATIIIDMVHHWTKHTAQPAPVSVEDVIKAVEESVHPSDHINYSNLRTALQTLFNPK